MQAKVHLLLCLVALIDDRELIPGHFGSFVLSHAMLQSGLTIVGCCFRDAVQPAFTVSEIMNRSATCFAKTTVGFISHFGIANESCDHGYGSF
jgi:hypothetical protein